MRRVVSIWFPTWPTDRLRRQNPDAWQPGEPLVTALHDGRRRVIAAADRAAAALGLYPGMPVAQAQAMVPGLRLAEADPAGDAAALAEVAGWCLRYAPLTAPDAPDGVWIEAAGCAHLFGGEASLLADIRTRFRRHRIHVRAAIADTPGAAWAMAHHGQAATFVVPSGQEAAALAPLPVAALRLADEGAHAALRRLGLDRVGKLAAAPRAPLALRFGGDVLRRLDQALGRVAEPISPAVPPAAISARLTFTEPLLTAEAIAHVIADLTTRVCATLEDQGSGARRLDLLFERVDTSLQAVRVGTARPARDPRHLARLLEEHTDTVDPGEGIEAMRLTISLAEPLGFAQPAAGLDATGDADTDIAPLVDRLINRLGAHRVWRAEPVESDLPERSVRRVPPLSPSHHRSWPDNLPRPARLLDPPQPIEAMALLPDQPPVQFIWRRVRHRIRRADGPERVHGEWWRDAAEVRSVRDYFAVEDEAGARFWLFRQGDGADPATGNLCWFLHGLF